MVAKLTWTSNRWHCDGRGIHAGTGMEMQFPDRTWQPVRIESQDCGRRLFAYFVYHGMDLCVSINPEHDRLRWPS